MTTQGKMKAFFERTKRIAKIVEKGKLLGAATEQAAQTGEAQEKVPRAGGKKVLDAVIKETKTKEKKPGSPASTRKT